MIVTIIFMIINISLIIGVPIYLKKVNKMYSFKTQDKDKKKYKRKDIKNIWGIENIKDGIITVGSSHSIIIELGSIEYRLLNEEEQNNIDSSLSRIAKTFEYQTQFFSTIERIDTTSKADDIRNNISKQKNEKIREYGESIIEYLEDIMLEENLYVRKNYLIVTSNEAYLDSKSNLRGFYDEVRNSLLDIKISAKLLNDIDIIELIHRELNKDANEKIRNIIEKGGLEFYVEAENKK